MTVIATAGHVDHGKSTLVRALTGTDPDRWQEEKDRGMTIDLGFAAAVLPSGRELGFVDVPGHCRFVKNMLSGVGSVDACLFVVDAAEGWKAQSEEHLRILGLLGVESGVVALTKVGRLDQAAVHAAVRAVKSQLAGSLLEAAEVVPVDAVAGFGVEDVLAAIDRLVSRLPAVADRGRPRLWIDRSFSVRGAGTVVTGTLTGGAIAVDDELAIEPGEAPVRVRGLQTHYRTLSRAEPVCRLAVNLTGVHARQVRRGQALVRKEQWHLTGMFDASLSVLAGAGRPLGGRGAYAVYTGTAEYPARLRVLAGRTALEPGESGQARFWLQADRRAPLIPGDRYVLRELGRDQTLGGGMVLDVAPVRRATHASPSLSADRVVAERGWIEPPELERLTGERRPANAGRWVVASEAWERLSAGLRAQCGAAGSAGVDLARLDEVERALLQAGVPGLSVAGGRAYAEGAQPAGLSDRASEVLDSLDKDPWSPPAFPLADRGALRELERARLAVEAGEVWFSTAAVQSAISLLQDLLVRQPGGFTVSDARVLLGSTRKYVLPLLGHLDATGWTRRQGDRRVAGPRMAARP